MDEKEIKQWNEMGFIPGPHEDEKSFKDRVSYCLKLKEVIPHQDSPCLKEGATLAAKRYGIAPTWVPLLFANRKLAPWHGGCAWIFQMSKESPIGSYLQLRKPMQHSRSYLFGLYKRETLVAHELCHVARMAFEEPKFEELFAYRLFSGWRNWVGPIIQSSSESMFFSLSLVLLLMAQLFGVFVDTKALHLAAWLALLPLSLIIAGFIRVWQRHRQLNRCLKILSDLCPKQAEAIAFRLADEEIMHFQDANLVKSYIDNQDSFRWKFLKTAYPEL